MTRRILSCVVAAVTAFILSNCSAPSTSPANSAGVGAVTGGASFSAASPAYEDASPKTESRNRPATRERRGIATGWGGKVDDRVSSTIFERDASRPVGVAKVFYNDLEGARNMAGGDYSLSNSFRDYSGGIFRVGLRNHRGAALSAYQSRGNLICIGEDGQRYSVEVENLSNHRLEFVVTVDGLDVLSGQTGSLSRRGYVLSPGERREIKGWRTSVNEVASFKFGKVLDSYVNNTTGNTANVGVVGTAVFAERGTAPRPYAGTDVYRRLHADPFVATPEGSGFAKPPR